MKLIDKENAVSEFDIGSSKIISMGPKCLMIGEVKPTEDIKFRTTFVRLDAAQGYKVVTDEGTEVALTSNVSENLAKLKAIGIVDNILPTAVSKETVAFYKNEDTDTPETIEVIVNFNFESTEIQLGDGVELQQPQSVTLKFPRSQDAVILGQDVISALINTEEFKAAVSEYATVAPDEMANFAIAGAYRLGTNDKKIYMKPTSKVLQDTTLYCAWKAKTDTTPVTQNEENPNGGETPQTEDPQPQTETPQTETPQTEDPQTNGGE